MSPKLAVVVGATGGQGGSVVASLLKAPETYKVRGLTRNTSSDAAKALIAKGVEVVAADLNDVDSLTKAFEGASYIFGVTNFFDTFFTESAEKSMDVEFLQGTNLAKAAANTASLEHFIWSTLQDSEKLTNGEIMVPHLQAKSRVNDFILRDESLFKKTTFLLVGFYASNLFYPPFTPNLLKSSEKYVLTLPIPASTKVGFIGDHNANLGIFAKAILENPGKTLGGNSVAAVTETMTFEAALSLWAKVNGKEDTAVLEVSMADYQVLFGEKWGLEMGVMCQFWAKAGDHSWDGPLGKSLLGTDLGLSEKSFITLEESWRATDWSSVL